jgi:hypothetical protein
MAILLGVRPRESRNPRGKNSFGHAHEPEQRIHVGPEPLPQLTFLVRQPGECVLGADAGQVRLAAPRSQPLPDLGVGLRIAVVQPLAAPGEVGAEPVEGLLAQEAAFLRRANPCKRRLRTPRIVGSPWLKVTDSMSGGPASL